MINHRQRNLVLALIMLASFGLTFFSAQPSFAQLGNVLPDSIPGLPSNFQTIQQIIGFIFGFIITIAGTIFMILLLVGGIQYLTSAGNEEGTGKAKRLMVDAIVGLILTLAAWAIGTFIIGRLGLDSRFGRSGGNFGRLPPWTATYTSREQFDQLQSECESVNGVLNALGNLNNGTANCASR